MHNFTSLGSLLLNIKEQVTRAKKTMVHQKHSELGLDMHEFIQMQAEQLTPVQKKKKDNVSVSSGTCACGCPESCTRGDDCDCSEPCECTKGENAVTDAKAYGDGKKWLGVPWWDWVLMVLFIIVCCAVYGFYYYAIRSGYITQKIFES